MFNINGKNNFLLFDNRNNELSLELKEINNMTHHIVKNELGKDKYSIFVFESLLPVEVGYILTDNKNIITDINFKRIFTHKYKAFNKDKYIGAECIFFRESSILIYEDYKKMDLGTVRLAGRDPESLVNGDGLRKVIFFQGCSLHCEGCFNESTHDFNGGQEFTVNEILEDIEKDDLIDGVTFSGGNPVEQSEPLSNLCIYCRALNIDIWLYSGFTFEELLEKSKTDDNLKAILVTVSVIVDGRFVQEQYEEGLRFKGSKNQRIINVPESLITGRIIEWKENQEGIDDDGDKL